MGLLDNKGIENRTLPDIENLGLKLHRILVQKSINEKRLAGLLGVSDQQVSAWLNNNYIMRKYHTIICTMLNISMEEFYNQRV